MKVKLAMPAGSAAANASVEYQEEKDPIDKVLDAPD